MPINWHSWLQVLRDTTRRGHRLYDTTENDRQICLADADYNGKIVEIEAEETEEDDLVKEYVLTLQLSLLFQKRNYIHRNNSHVVPAILVFVSSVLLV